MNYFFDTSQISFTKQRRFLFTEICQLHMINPKFLTLRKMVGFTDLTIPQEIVLFQKSIAQCNRDEL